MHNLGYKAGVHPQNSGVVKLLWACTTLIPATSMLLVALVFLKYPIKSEEMQSAIKRSAVARHRGESVDDPVTGATLSPPEKPSSATSTMWSEYFYSQELRLSHKIGRKHSLLGLAGTQFGFSVLLGVGALWLIVDGFNNLSGENQTTWAPIGAALVVVSFGLVYFNGYRIWVALEWEKSLRDGVDLVWGELDVLGPDRDELDECEKNDLIRGGPVATGSNSEDLVKTFDDDL
eukprot:TRINITY_DN20023_c0_g1_i3.p1 TRINITY_DN20023_c0_g1~~TRINITY_DN20023_c0_g1_i3.p1  ORF type:complete len:233 (-),score=42.47 TRINITY_DN20023_c0_g1_i3:274-972(-)